MEYYRAKAVAYAHEWAYRRNPEFYNFQEIGGDCTNFASQCLFAGAGIMNYTPLYGWFYISTNDRTPSWTGVEELYNFLVSNTGPGPQGVVVPLNEIQDGDIIQIRFGLGPRYDHSPVVVDRGEGTADTILVAAHSRDVDCRPISTYQFSRLRPIHIYNVGAQQ